MSKFNNPVELAPRSPVTGTVTGRVTYEGGRGAERDAKSELFLLAVSNMVGENTFYENAPVRDGRFVALVRHVAATDPDWMLRFGAWLRNGANMRSAALVAAAEAAYTLRDATIPGGREIVNVALSRADEPGEMLAYCIANHGRQLPMAVKKGVADAITRLYSEYSFLKWNSDARTLRFADAIELTHPKAIMPWQGDLFRHILNDRHDRAAEIPESLHTLRERATLMQIPVEQRRHALMDGGYEMMRQAGMTWESLAGWLQGPMDKLAWEAVIPNMGYMALLRNLRNFDEAGVSDETARWVCGRLSDPEEVAKSRQLPLRFVSAYLAASSLRWSWALEQAVNLSLRNVPTLKDRTLILVDRSGSMFGAKLSERSSLDFAKAAALFGSALALRAESATLVQFGTDSYVVDVRVGDSLLTVTKRFAELGGTNTEAALRAHYAGHDRVVIVTDEQAHFSPVSLPDTVPMYTWNLAGYRFGHAESGKNNRHTFGGLSDAAFTMLDLLEHHRDASWPF